jgi:ribosomal protein L28
VAKRKERHLLKAKYQQVQNNLQKCELVSKKEEVKLTLCLTNKALRHEDV